MAAIRFSRLEKKLLYISTAGRGCQLSKGGREFYFFYILLQCALDTLTAFTLLRFSLVLAFETDSGEIHKLIHSSEPTFVTDLGADVWF